MKKFIITEDEKKRIQRLYEFDNPFKTSPSSYKVAKAVGFAEAKRKKECYEIMILDELGYSNVISNICDNGYFDIKNESNSSGSVPTTGKWVIENNTITITLSDGKTFSGPISDKSLQSQIAQYIVNNFTKFESGFVDNKEMETVKSYISGSQQTTSTEQGVEQTDGAEQSSTETTTEKPTNKISQIQQKVVDAGLKDLLGPKGVDGRFGPYTADAVLQLLNKK